MHRSCSVTTAGQWRAVPGALSHRKKPGQCTVGCAYHPPPPPPPDDPPLELLELPLESLLELGAATPTAIPAAAAAHAPLAPAPPERPPPPLQPVCIEDELGELPLVLSSAAEALVVVVVWRTDQASTCLPRPKASSHGYQPSRRLGRGFSSSLRKKLRALTKRLRKAMAPLLCRDFMLLIDAFEMARAKIVKAPTIVHGRSTSPTAAYHQRNAAAPRMTTDAGISRMAAAFSPQSIRDLNSHPGICRIATRNSEIIATARAPLPRIGSEYELNASSTRPVIYRTTLVQCLTRLSPGGNTIFT